MAIGTSSGSRTAIRCGQRAAPSGEGPTHMGDVPWRCKSCCAGQRWGGVYAGMSWAGVTSLGVAVSRAMEPSER